ncbi:MAG: CoA-binding protein [Ignavibacteria bacterium]|nr:CoA-binding protein [Ignavibacteria bacterium]
MKIIDILNNYRKIAAVGFSDNPFRYSNEVAMYIKKQGYEVYGVNPNLGGKTIGGIKCFSSLNKIDFKINIVNVFRKSEFVIDAVNDAAEMRFKPDVIWVQDGIFSAEGRQKAEDSGIYYLENKCILNEHRKLINDFNEK